jgi:putative tryptophan/tyrosine transport system substrate-binding protein
MSIQSMKRRAFIAALGGAAAWPLVARAQSERVRRIGVLMNVDDADNRASYAAFVEALQRLGWTDGRNVRIETRWPGSRASALRSDATDLVALAPDVLVAAGAVSLAPLLQATHTVPIVFAAATDPVGVGFIESMAHPGGNTTGFAASEYTLGGKWLELLKEIAPSVRRTAVLRDPALTIGIGQFAVIQSVAPALGLEVTAIDLRDASDIEPAVTAFAGSPNGGVIVAPGRFALANRELIIALAAKYKLPAVYYRRRFVASGGLMSYDFDILEQYRGAAGYVDRILKGEKPADLPVQAPTKYVLTINLKTAKALGLDVPPTLLARADQVIE